MLPAPSLSARCTVHVAKYFVALSPGSSDAEVPGKGHTEDRRSATATATTPLPRTLFLLSSALVDNPCWSLGLASAAAVLAVASSAVFPPLALAAVGAGAGAMWAVRSAVGGEAATQDSSVGDGGVGEGDRVVSASAVESGASVERYEDMPTKAWDREEPAVSSRERTPRREKATAAAVQRRPPPPPLGTTVVAHSFPAPLTARGFYDLFLSNGAPHCVSRFHEYSGDLEVKFGGWTYRESDAGEGGSEDSQLQVRTLTFRKKNRALVGPAYAFTTKSQRLLRPVGRNLFAMESETRLTGIPYSDRFHCVERWVAVSPAPNGGGVALTVSVDIIFTKGCMFERKIRSNTLAGVRHFVSSWCRLSEDVVRDMKSSGDVDRLEPSESGKEEDGEDGIKMKAEINRICPISTLGGLTKRGLSDYATDKIPPISVNEEGKEGGRNAGSGSIKGGKRNPSKKGSVINRLKKSATRAKGKVLSAK